MKHIITILICILLTSCHTATKVVTVDRPTHDTLIISNVKYDSIYFDHWHYIDRNADTVRVVEHHTEHRYQLLHDTVYVSRIDSIPVVKEVEVPRKRSTLDLISLNLFGFVLGGFIILLACMIYASFKE